MKKIVVFFAIIMMSSSAFADCAALIKKYEAPDPASKTMTQIERWVQRAVTDAADAAEITKCLIAGAADNPNKVQVAGK